MKINWKDLFYIVPAFPIFTRLILFLQFVKEMGEYLPEGELDRAGHRTHILALAGFSFTGFIALTVIEGTLLKGFSFPIYYLLVSFLGYLFSLNLQGYKSKRWQDQLGTALMEVASLSLILTIASVLFVVEFGSHFAPRLAILALTVWLIDHACRLKFQANYLSERRKSEMSKKEQEKDKEKSHVEYKELDFEVCPKHGLRYPKGSGCPRCEEEKNKA
jgi:hypothetical protein